MVLALSLSVIMAGCGDFFEKKPIELETKAILRDISRVRENPHVGNALPQVYLDPPKRLEVEDGVKLFYFTKYMPVGNLNFGHKDANLVKKVHGYGGTIRDMGFKINTNPSTNQLIIHCVNHAECDQVLEYLKKTDVPPIQIHIDCLILERFGDNTEDWETTIMIENFLGEGLTLGAAKFPDAAFPGASLRETRRSEFGLDIGYWIDQGVPGHQVRAVVDMLESRGYLKVLMNPTLETVNGKEATVQILDKAPIEKLVTERNFTYAVTEYKDVVDTLTVTPYVYADGSIGLRTNITIGSKSKPEGVVQTSIITERSIEVGENRIEPGKSLVIGGMRKSEIRSVIRGVPFFKDLPLIGVLFSSKDYEEKATEITFVLTPSVSSGGVDYEDVADVVREKFAMPDYKSDIDQMVSDPLGADVYTNVMKKQAEKAETERVRLEVQAAQVKRQAQRDRLRAEQSIADAQALRAHTKESEAMIEKANAQKAAAEAEKQVSLKEAEAQKVNLNQTQAQLKKIQDEAAAARKKAEESKVRLQEAEAQAKKRAEEVKKAEEKAEAVRKRVQEIEKQIQAEEAAAQAVQKKQAEKAAEQPAEKAPASQEPKKETPAQPPVEQPTPQPPAQEKKTEPPNQS